LFLDEIGDLPPSMQVKLLRAVQERSIQRLGGERPIRIDVRLYCATHHELRARVSTGQFREDLYYRIAVVELNVPPLRSRPQDILWLTEQFLAEQARMAGEAPRILTPAAQAALLTHAWPGNVRELRNRVERACILSQGGVLSPEDLFADRARSDDESSVGRGLPSLDDFVGQAERSYLRSVLELMGGRIGAAAEALGISRKTLWEKMRRHGIKARDPH
jgi:DNA-binding NtrC family response regulator